MNATERATEKLMSLGIALRYEDRKLVKEGQIHAAIASVRERFRRLHRTIWILGSVVIAGYITFFFLWGITVTQMIIVLLMIGGMIGSLLQQKHMERILGEAESLLEEAHRYTGRYMP